MVDIVIFGSNMNPVPITEVIGDLDSDTRRKIRYLARHCNKDQVIFYCPRCGTVACILKSSIEYIFEKHSNYHRQMGVD